MKLFNRISIGLGVILVIIFAYDMIEPYSSPLVTCASGPLTSFPQQTDDSNTPNGGLLKRVLAYAPVGSHYEECLRRTRLLPRGGAVYLVIKGSTIENLQTNGTLSRCRLTAPANIIPADTNDVSIPLTRSLSNLKTYDCLDASIHRINANTTAQNSYEVTTATYKGNPIILFEGDSDQNNLPTLPM